MGTQIIIRIPSLISKKWWPFCNDRTGNIALSFALLLVPLIGAVGASLDYVRAYNTRSKMQSDLDTALLAAIKSVGSVDEAALQKRVEQWFAAQTDLSASAYEVADIGVDVTNVTITATARSTVPTTLMQVLGVKIVDVSVSSTVQGPGQAYMNVYVVLDKSASMLLAATAQGQSTMLSSPAKCAFACHTAEGTTFKYKGKTYSNVYDLSVAMGIKLRADVSVSAVGEILNLVAVSDPKEERIKVGLYTLGQTTKEVLAPALSISSVRKLLTSNSSGLTSSSSEAGTYFDSSLTSLGKLVGNGGDGKTAGNPKKLVLLLTDGVQSERNWVLQSNSGIRFPSSASILQTVVTPLNSKWCQSIKDQNVSFGVLYTEYLPMTWDWGYNATVGKTMNSSSFASVWNGTIASGGGAKTRLEYIPIALKECASAKDLFLHAESEDEIKAGLSELFKQYLSKVRLAS
ncbi:pilus assembly protein [Rhizobium laguerreae]|uniref:TadE/TadG family type IV pilus assembly protein n=1 Tax=Rhizobium laguerreae TaxID=1076926 RepID=UPI001E2A7CB2|nr:TadE/TadG family type IV pilus assembly protein [Rhizobium laguerreae]UFW63295.1 pilus assembly protein [Rhizobium laguerreae]